MASSLWPLGVEGVVQPQLSANKGNRGQRKALGLYKTADPKGRRANLD